MRKVTMKNELIWGFTLGSVAMFVSLSDNWPNLEMEKSDD